MLQHQARHQCDAACACACVRRQAMYAPVADATHSPVPTHAGYKQCVCCQAQDTAMHQKQSCALRMHYRDSVQVSSSSGTIVYACCVRHKTQQCSPVPTQAGQCTATCMKSTDMHDLYRRRTFDGLTSSTLTSPEPAAGGPVDPCLPVPPAGPVEAAAALFIFMRGGSEGGGPAGPWDEAGAGTGTWTE